MLAPSKRFRAEFIGVLAFLVSFAPALVFAQDVVAARILRKVSGENLKLPSSGDWRARFKDSEMPRMQKIAENIYLFQAPHGTPGLSTNSLIVITTDGVVVLDGQGNDAAVKRMIEEIRRLTPQPIKYLVIGSAHGDHNGGNKAFPPGVTFVGHAILQTWYDMDTATRKADPKAWVYHRNPARLITITDFVGTVPANLTAPPPAVTKVLKVGDTELRITFPGLRAHSGPDLQTYLPRERILWMAESFTPREFPSMGSSAYPSEWERILRQTEARLGKDVDNILGAHGFMDSPEVNREEFVNFRRIVEGVNAEARRLYQAKIPLEEVESHWNYGPYLSSLLLSSHAWPSVWKNYLELQGKLPACPPCSPDPGESDNHYGAEPGWQWPPAKTTP